jgi:hypothetical protein
MLKKVKLVQKTATNIEDWAEIQMPNPIKVEIVKPYKPVVSESAGRILAGLIISACFAVGTIIVFGMLFGLGLKLAGI